MNIMRGTRQRTRMIVVGLALAAPIAISTAAAASPPHGGDSGHVHHVHTGNGGCVVIDQRAFNAENRGLHQGASNSGVERGPWHGPCH